MDVASITGLRIQVARAGTASLAAAETANACSSANAALKKLYNWSCLNKKVFKRLGFVLTKDECGAVSTCQPGAVERVLKLLQARTVQQIPSSNRRLSP